METESRHEPRALSAHKAHWLEQAWQILFAGGDSPLMAPGQIRRERRDRTPIRRAEMAAVVQAEKELRQLRDGSKVLNAQGRVVDAPRVEHVETHSIIETPVFDQHQHNAEMANASSMLGSAIQEVSLRDLERSLNVRKIALLLEGHVVAAAERPVSRLAVDPDWVRRWRECAQDAFDRSLQRLWARALAAEVARPGSLPLATLEALRLFGPGDVQVAQMAARYSLGDHVFDASGSYFEPGVHRPLFESATELGLITGIGAGETVELAPGSGGPDAQYLVCHRHALCLQGFDESRSVRLPVWRVTRAGRQLFALCEAEADLAYLYALAHWLKTHGLTVTLGDWDHERPERDRFIARLEL